jgi:hypothetical protein
MYAKFWCDKEKVDGIISVAKAYLAVLTERTETLRKTNNLTDEESDLFRHQAKQADEVYRTIEGFEWSVKSGDTDQTENEQLAAINAWIKEELVKHSRGMHVGDLVKSLKAYFKDVIDEKENAYKVFATLADDMRVKLLAVQFLLEQAEHGATHREKNYRINQINQTITTLIENLGRVDKNNPRDYYYHISRSNVGSWDYVQTLTEMHHRKTELENLKKEVEQLRLDNAALGDTISDLQQNKLEEKPAQRSYDNDNIPF